jgi:ABC-type sugar transport system ATPase subunit
MLIQNQMRSRALMGVLSGQRAHQGGHLYVGNQEVSALTPDSARRAGIYCIGPRPTLTPR